MTIQQMEYIVALDTYRHFVLAAEACSVTQPTLSLMIQKLEAEIDVTIFDRRSHPVCPTAMGEKLIAQARVVLYNCSAFRQIVQSEKQSQTGLLRLAIIPTVAPYIVPGLIDHITTKHPLIDLQVSEMRTDVVVSRLKRAQVDVAILATPLEDEQLLEVPLFYEKFVGYVSPHEAIFAEPQIVSSQMPIANMWVLQEGHCLRGQVLNFCNQSKPATTIYEAGSIDTLVRIVDTNGGYTIIPELHLNHLSQSQLGCVRPLASPSVVREISLVVRRDYIGERMMNIVAQAVRGIVPAEMVDKRLEKFAIRL